MSKTDLRSLLQSVLPANDNKPAEAPRIEKPRVVKPPRPPMPARMNRALRPRRRS